MELCWPSWPEAALSCFRPAQRVFVCNSLHAKKQRQPTKPSEVSSAYVGWYVVFPAVVVNVLLCFYTACHTTLCQPHYLRLKCT